MTAYSFRRQFVAPILVGLGLEPVFESIKVHGDPRAGIYVPKNKWPTPKRQTIRADRKRHARLGEELQLYCGMRTRQCFLIGRARCVGVYPIVIDLKRETVKVRDTLIAGSNLLDFARGDGFQHWMAMRDFWRETHGIGKFDGVLIRWEPL